MTTEDSPGALTLPLDDFAPVRRVSRDLGCMLLYAESIVLGEGAIVGWQDERQDVGRQVLAADPRERRRDVGPPAALRPVAAMPGPRRNTKAGRASAPSNPTRG